MDDPQITVLGSATPYPRPDNACSGFLVTGAGTRLWLDAGPGTLAQLQRHARPDEIDAVWISHLHADHCADLLPAYYALLFADLSPAAPIPLYGPPGIADRLAAFLTNGPRRSPVESAFEVHELRDGHEVRVGGLTLHSRAVDHGMPAYAVRIGAAGRSLVYSGDTAPCAALDSLARACDLLVCEADSDTVPAGEPPVHHTPEEAGATAARAGATRLLLTHVGPAIAPDRAVARAASAFPGPVAYAEPGGTYPVVPG
ncbi:MBL fold metallo-hydrolase [Actinocatenispora rupis]|uniref:MBL fold metallo-hydrolase n=1 Tax=Actinocatenispora rupis TaxID=519421 RepID=A0A8J3J2W5_9ACTN|nr:MBL fold metallo-hydrolase [Actinocatenispora rupis]GID13193.1 MBL fold metallo-hydrolase [Actinocatenispora rupis]